MGLPARPALRPRSWSAISSSVTSWAPKGTLSNANSSYLVAIVAAAAALNHGLAGQNLCDAIGGPSLPRQWGHLRIFQSFAKAAHDGGFTELTETFPSPDVRNGQPPRLMSPVRRTIGRSNGFFIGGGDTLSTDTPLLRVGYLLRTDNQRLFARHISCALIASCKQVSGTEGCPGAGGGSLRA